MKKIRFLLFMLLALFYVTNANALIGVSPKTQLQAYPLKHTIS